MSQTFKGILAALAVGATFGAIQLASGHDLAGAVAAAVPEAGINRAAKADRAPIPAASMPTRTIALQPDGSSDTSVLLRLPVPQEARNRATPAAGLKPRGSRNAVACEPPVSVLTEVAKLLQPGRCVT